MPNVRPILPPLKTPKSATFPSELHDDSPSTSISSSMKQEDSASGTPLTPHSSIPLPKAYTEFLEAMTPVFSPASAGANFPKFPLEKTSASPTSQPGSALSGSFAFSPLTTRSPTISLPPPTPGSAVYSRKGFPLPRRLRIPQSLKYSPTSDSPRSANSLRSPYSTTDWKLRYIEPPRSSGGKPVSVKQIVTRTVTYKRTQLDAPPKGKRRKCRDSKDGKEIKDVHERKEFKEFKEFKDFKEFKMKKEATEV
ncbi:uncharacterized protein N7483_009209 [Penicillium malachiteum]|uniref:uncharacterized protein n=1 Tax=Penicillium malachiteum TaxID=1324776 RepID=UPI00254991DE|nr:uncharacterized protein N7483_009209 [Penicillium malachiteum]KAJ5721275.1 hypothetical protein N7483_009209 [Penicillium malachiteum]